MKPGDIIDGRFEIEQLAGEGGMGAVYQARELGSGSLVALKLLTGADRSASGQQRFAREARVLAKLGHPGIVRHVGHGVTPEGMLYLAMEWLEGKDLAALLSQSGSLSIGDALTLARGVAEALDAAHVLGVVHRDIKPQNVFLQNGDVERVKLVDFGLARAGVETQALTRTGLFLGTPSYAAPEQVRVSREVDGRADIFSLGCVLFECLTGRPPFVAAHVMGVFAKVLFEEVPSVGEARPEAPAALCDLVSRMLCKDASERPQSAAAVVQELSAIHASSPFQAARPAVTLPAQSAGEQQLVSVILAGVPSEGTGMLAPGDVIPAFERLRALVTPLEARVECLAGGSVIATIAGKAAAIDQATQTARCALSMHAALPDVPMVLATGRSALDKRLPVGQVIDHAVSLLQARTNRDPGAACRHGAQPIYLDELTAGLLELRFELGGEPGAPELIGERDIEEGVRTLLGKPTPCVGRERDLAMLQGLFNECVTEPRAHAVIVTAGAGMGKSRLRHEFVRYVRQGGAVTPGKPVASLWVAYGDPLQLGSPYRIAGQLIQRAAGLADADPPEVRRDKLRARVERHVRAADAARVTELLGEIAGAPFADEDRPYLRAARRDPARMGEQIKQAFEQFVSAECEARPVLVVLEDLHWGDVPSMQLIDAALKRLSEEPFMVLALARPELRELVPDLWRGGDVQELRLGNLSRKASMLLARTVLGDAVSEEIIGRVADTAAGNAFYLEELIRAVAQGVEGSLPETVLAMVQSRLDALEPEARQVMRAASVLGEVFWAGGAAALVHGSHGGERVQEWLDVLVERELIRPRAYSKLPGEKEYIFRHALVRDGAYGTLSEADRAIGHRLAAEWLERVARPDAMVPVERLGLIGDHFLRGECWDKGAEYLHQAGDAAFKLFAYPEARTHFDRALQCLSRLDETEEWRLRRMNILLCYHETVWLNEDPDKNLARLLEVLRLAQSFEGRDGQWHVARVNAVIGRMSFIWYDYDASVEYLQKALDAAMALNDDELVGAPSMTLGLMRSVQGRWAESEVLLTRAIPFLEASADWWSWFMAVGNLCIGLAARGEYPRALENLVPIKARAAGMHSPSTEMIAHIYYMYTHFVAGDFPRMVEAGQASLEAARRSGDAMIVWAAHYISAWGLANLGDPEAAERHAEQAHVVFRQFGERLFAADWFLATDAGRVLLAGRPAEALVLVEKAIEATRRVKALWAEGLAQRFWGQALASLDPPRFEEADVHFAESERLLGLCDAKPDCARTHRAWGLACRARGDAAEARRHFEKAVAYLEATGALDELEAARALLT